MKKIRKTAVICIVSLMVICFGNISVFATTTMQDGLEVTLTTDKKDYNRSENIVAELTVKNTNEIEVTEILLENIIPDGYKVADGTSLTKAIDTLSAGESVSFNITYISNVDETPQSTETTTTETATAEITTNSTLTSTTESGKNIVATNDVSTGNSVVSQVNTANVSVQTGSHLTTIIICLLTLLISVLLCYILKKKKSKQTLLLILFYTIFAILKIFPSSIISEATEIVTKTLSISETAKINDNKVVINATVTYNFMNQEEINEADKYYQETSEKIFSTEYANENNTLSEKEVYTLLSNKNINQYPIIYEYDLNGIYIGESKVDNNSSNKHPMYQTFYETANGDLWNIFVVGRAVYASALSYNLESNTEIEYIFGEDDTLVCYADSDNKYYFTIPKDTAVSYHVLGNLNANALDKLTFEEIDKL